MLECLFAASARKTVPGTFFENGSWNRFLGERDILPNDPPLSREGVQALGMAIPEVRFEEEVARFAEADRKTPPRQGGVLFLGDSDIRLWGQAGVEADFPGLPVLNRGFGGARTWEALLHFPRLVLPCRPRVIVYCCGDNDIARLKEQGVASAVTGFRLFLDLVASHAPGVVRILYLAIHPSPSDAPLWGFIGQANVEIRALCEASPTAEFVDYLHLLRDDQGQLSANWFMPDRLHFTRALYRRLGAFLRPRVQAAWMDGA